MNCKRLFLRIAACLIIVSLPCLFVFAIAMNVYEQANQWGWMFALQPFFFIIGFACAVAIIFLAYVWAETQLNK